MWVSKEFYTPEKFIDEAKDQGISKRVAANSLPVGFVVGRDWVFLAHGEVPFPIWFEDDVPPIGPDGEKHKEPKIPYKPAIFYAFKPQRLELVLWKGTDADTIREYEEVGYHVVLIEKTEENLKRHGNGKYPPLPTGKGKAVRKTGLIVSEGDSSHGGPLDVEVPTKGGMSGPMEEEGD